MEKLRVKAELREVGQKGMNRRLRREGYIPAILYGGGTSPIGLKVRSREFTSMMKGAAGLNVLIDLEVGASARPVVVMLKDFQTDVLTRAITHMDLLRIDLKEKVSVKVPIHLVGKAVGVEKGGLIEQARRELDVISLPGNIPARIDVDITPLDLGGTLHIHDLKLPEGVELPHGADYTIVSIVAPREEVVAPPVTPEQVAVPATTGEAAAPAPAKAAEAKGEKK